MSHNRYFRIYFRPRISGIPSLHRTTHASCLGAFFRFVGPLVYRLAQMGGTTPARAAALIAHPIVALGNGLEWASNVCLAHADATVLHDSFTPQELHMVSRIVPRGNIITMAVASDIFPSPRWTLASPPHSRMQRGLPRASALWLRGCGA